MLGRRLKECRGKRTQEEISILLGISRARYSHYENQHVQPDNDMLQKMADLYNVSVDYLLGRTGDPEKKGDTPVINEDATLVILKELADKYNIDLTDPVKRKKLEDVIKLVADYRIDGNSL